MHIITPVEGLSVDQLKKGVSFAKVDGKVGGENGLLENTDHVAVLFRREIAQNLIALAVEYH